MRARRLRAPSTCGWSAWSTTLVGAFFISSGVIGCASGDGATATGAGGTSVGGTTGIGGTSGAGAAGTAGTAGTTGSAGASGASGTTGSAGASGEAGSTGAAGASGTGGGAAAGNPGTGGVTTGTGGSGGRGGVGGSVALGGQGGTISTGRGGATAGTGGSGGAATRPSPDPSTGCGKTNPATGTSSSPLTVSSHKYYVKLPAGYDGSKPFPVLFMFNPTNNPITWAEQNAGYETNGAKTGAIRVYPDPASEASGWGAGDVSFFMPLYNAITSSFCVDKGRVFAAGESSGGDFSGIIGCEYANVLRGVVPCSTKDVSQYPLDATKRKCTGEVTAIVIQGKNDNVVGPENGPKMRDFYRAINHCGTTTVPVSGYTDTLSNCVEYQGCDAGFPVYWCQHTDPNYSNTNHGWPAFAANMTWGVFSSY